MPDRFKIAPKPGFDGSHIVWSAPDAPQPVICSYCSDGLPEVPLMMCKESGACALFCDTCARRWFSMVRFPE
jgi:hypothetical protein